MGGGKEKKKTNQMLAEDRARGNAEHSQFMTGANQDADTARKRSSDLWDTVSSGYKTFAAGGPAAPAAAFGGGGGGGETYSMGAGTRDKLNKVEGFYDDLSRGGGYDPEKLRGGQSVYRDAMTTGGWDPDSVARMRGDAAGMRGIGEEARARVPGLVSGLRDIGNDIGIDAEGRNRMRGLGVFDEFARTGGYSDSDIRNIRARSSSAIPSAFSAARDEVSRSAALSGMGGPGQAALIARMGREQARLGAANRRDTELGIADRVREGRFQGASALSGAEGTLQGLQGQLAGQRGNLQLSARGLESDIYDRADSTRMGALQSAAGLEGNIEGNLSANRMAGADRFTSSEQAAQDRILSGREKGFSGLHGLAGEEEARDRRDLDDRNAASARSAASSAADARWAAEWDRENRMYGLGGLDNLYGRRDGALEAAQGMNLESRRLNTMGNAQGIDQRMANNPQRDWLQTIAGVAGGVGGAMTGLGNLGYGRRPGGGG